MLLLLNSGSLLNNSSFTSQDYLIFQILYHSTILFSTSPKVFGCACFVHDPKHQQDNPDAEIVKWIVVGYPSTQKGISIT